MSKQLIAISDGEYIFMESEKENEFFFFREDKGVIEEYEELILNFFAAYTLQKYSSINDEEPDVCTGSMFFETLNEGTCIRVTTADTIVGKNTKKPSFIKRIFEKIKTALK